MFTFYKSKHHLVGHLNPLEGTPGLNKEMAGTGPLNMPDSVRVKPALNRGCPRIKFQTNTVQDPAQIQAY